MTVTLGPPLATSSIFMVFSLEMRRSGLWEVQTMNIEEVARGGPRVTVIRQPKGPDGTKGFRPRGPKERSPAVPMDLMEQLTAQ
jgi:hypothetical protein